MPIRLAYAALVFLSLVGVISCGGGDSPPTGTDSGTPRSDSGLSPDSGADLDSGVASDSGSRTDLGPDAEVSDAGTPTDAAARSDAGAGAACAADSAIPDRLAGVCDGRGRAICIMWATMSGGAGATAQCIPGGMGRCGRADACSATSCTCGSSPECDDDQMCALDPASGGYACKCISAAPTP